jgi:hypothetical protein
MGQESQRSGREMHPKETGACLARASQKVIQMSYSWPPKREGMVYNLGANFKGLREAHISGKE